MKCVLNFTFLAYLRCELTNCYLSVFVLQFISKLIYQVVTGIGEFKDLRDYEEETQQLDDMSDDLNETIKNQSIDLINDDLINKKGANESTDARHNNLRKRSRVGVQSY